MNLYFGYSWDEIQKAQQGESLGCAIIHTKPNEATEDDIKMLETIGMDGLKEKGFWGIIDRLQNSKLI